MTITLPKKDVLWVSEQVVEGRPGLSIKGQVLTIESPKGFESLKSAIDLLEEQGCRRSGSFIRSLIARATVGDDYEPEQAWGTSADIRRHERFGGTRQDY
jgi:hypothetical protein